MLYNQGCNHGSKVGRRDDQFQRGALSSHGDLERRSEEKIFKFFIIATTVNKVVARLLDWDPFLPLFFPSPSFPSSHLP